MSEKITIKDIARLAGVSVGSVSTVFSKKSTNVHLSEQTRDKNASGMLSGFTKN